MIVGFSSAWTNFSVKEELVYTIQDHVGLIYKLKSL